jgi:Bacterial dipeptidyl-peptidase Sh3 domain
MTGAPFVCVGGIAPVRAEPDPQSRQLTDLLFGEEFLAVSEREGLAFGTTDDGVEGFVACESLAPKSGQSTHSVRRTFIHVYHAPDLMMASDKILPMNALVGLTGRAAPLRYPGGGTGSAVVELRSGGWVSEQGVTPIGQSADLAAIARSFIGAVYLPGGKTWLGCDGPGFVQTALAACGTRVPRQREQQISFFARAYPELDGPPSELMAAVVYAGSSCGFLLGSEVVAARAETLRVDVTPLEAFPSRDHLSLPRRIFRLSR